MPTLRLIAPLLDAEPGVIDLVATWLVHLEYTPRAAFMGSFRGQRRAHEAKAQKAQAARDWSAAIGRTMKG
ncbi:hypothetical protein ABB27_02420 [Stenotrophomonas terrae]|uniref:Uncharacterized protein n=1 Tax=Stenotrophomonas terrae TaxID=405446 RepID=A0A0R0CQC9_9GAMM|nr:hypothetical protein ABB27_02420 [Stenotrophomonas terrae]